MICRASATWPELFTPADGLIIDNFAGGGGAGLGIEIAIGRPVDHAINHCAKALAMHRINHPGTVHHHSDVWEVDPRDITQGAPVLLAHFSPDCKHFSKAKGGKPVSPRVRGLAWVVVRWAHLVRPRIITLENVEEFQTWGPLADDGRPCPQRKGSTFHGWVGKLRKLGYAVEWRELRACDFGAPTIRKRLFLVARCDGQPIHWPDPTHGDPKSEAVRSGRLLAWVPAASGIDFTRPCPSIFERKRPLADNTLRRVAAGIMRHVINNPKPFVVSIANYGDGTQARSSGDPLSTITASPKGGHHALVSPTLVQTGYGERAGQAPRVPGSDKPLGTIVATGKHALVSAFLAKHYTGVVGSPLDKPIGAITSVDHHSLVTAHLNHQHSSDTQGNGGEVDQPLATITSSGNHAALVSALLVEYYGNSKEGMSADNPLHTITTRDRFGLVRVDLDGVSHVITDIGLRMLIPRELYTCQGFAADWVIDRGIDADGNIVRLTADDQVRMVGNSVSPHPMAALIRDNLKHWRHIKVTRGACESHA